MDINRIDQIILHELDKCVNNAMQMYIEHNNDQIIEPFYVSFRLEEHLNASMTWSNGSMIAEDSNHKYPRTYFVGEIRLGDYNKCGYVGRVNEIDYPLFRDETNIEQDRKVLVDMSDRFMKNLIVNATKEYLREEAQSLMDNRKFESFTFYSKEDSNIFLKNIDRGFKYKMIENMYNWKEILKEVSKQLHSPDLYKSEVEYSIDYIKRMFVNSEGSKIVDGFGRSYVLMCADALNPNNRKYDMSQRWYDLPCKPEIIHFLSREAETLCKKVQRTSNAEPQESGGYPVILDPENLAVLVHEALGHHVEEHRHDKQEDDEWAGEGHGLIFYKKLGQKVAPDFISISDDPHLEGGFPYDYDAEGVLAKKTVIIEDGVLRNYLSSRETAGKHTIRHNKEKLEDIARKLKIKRISQGYMNNYAEKHKIVGYKNDIEEMVNETGLSKAECMLINIAKVKRIPFEYQEFKSNGHARTEGINDPVARMSNLDVVSKNEIPYEDLKQKLIDICKERGIEYGLLLKGSNGGETDPGSGFFTTAPEECYRIYTDGREELVRDIEVAGLPHNILHDIVATSNEYGWFKGTCGAESGYIPVSAKAPHVLINNIQINMLPEEDHEQVYPDVPKKSILDKPMIGECGRNN